MPGDYYVARVRPTGWLLRPRTLSPVPSYLFPLFPLFFSQCSSFGFRSLVRVPIGADVRIYGECIQFTRIHAHAPVRHGPHGRVRAYILAPVDSLASLGGEGRRGDEVSGILSEQKARKQNAIMISPKDGWSKLPQIPAPRMAEMQLRFKSASSHSVRHAVKLVLRIDRKLTHTETTTRS